MRETPRSRSQRPHLLTALAGPAAALLFVGCSTSPTRDEMGETSEDALTAANDEYDSLLSEVGRLQGRCESEHKCDASNLKTASLGLGSGLDLGLEPLTTTANGGEATRGTSKLRSYKLCEALKPFAALESPYFFVGANANASIGKTVADGGVDLVFDLAHEQAALFRYHSHGYQTLIGAEASAYVGYGFGKKANVLDAWSGDFETSTATADVLELAPFLGVSLGGSMFRAPDKSIWGAAAAVGFGLNALGPLSEIEVAASEGFWTPWDAATTTFGHHLFFVSYDEETTKVIGKKHTYLQFKSTKDLALALVEKLGPLGVLPASQAAGLAALRRQGLTIARACSKSK